MKPIQLAAILIAVAWIILEAIGYANNPYRKLGLPPPGSADTRHTLEQLRSIGLSPGMSRDEAEARMKTLGFTNCAMPADGRGLFCKWKYRELLSPWRLTWIVKLEFADDKAKDMSSLTGYFSDEY